MTNARKPSLGEDQVYHASNLNERSSAVTDGLKCIGFSSLRGNRKTTTRILDVLFRIHESVIREKFVRRGLEEFAPCCGVRNIQQMIRRSIVILRRTCVWVAALFCAIALISTGALQAAQISGTIAATMVITEDSQLVGDVTCTVTGAPCLDIAASNVTLDLNGFSMTGQAEKPFKSSVTFDAAIS